MCSFTLPLICSITLLGHLWFIPLLMMLQCTVSLCTSFLINEYIKSNHPRCNCNTARRRLWNLAGMPQVVHRLLNGIRTDHLLPLSHLVSISWQMIHQHSHLLYLQIVLSSTSDVQPFLSWERGDFSAIVEFFPPTTNASRSTPTKWPQYSSSSSSCQPAKADRLCPGI